MGITRINNNLSAITTQRNINRIGDDLSKSIERLSSGLRINRAADDAAGMSVANRLRTQNQGLNVAIANSQDGINLINLAEGGLEETTNRLNRVRELALQAANTGVNDFGARQSIQDEVSQSIEEITRIANTTQFSSNYLLNGNFSIRSTVKTGQQDIGAKIDSSPVASNMDNGTAFLNIQLTNSGFSQIVAGDASGAQQILNTGIQNLTDVAVSMARFSKTSLLGAGVNPADRIAGTSGSRIFFNGVSIKNQDVVVFSGVLADGVTKFTGVLSVGAGATFTFGSKTDTVSSDARTHLLGAINKAIQNAEKSLFGVTTVSSVPTAYSTTVTLGRSANAGRLLMFSTGNYISQSDINLTLLRSGKTVSQSKGVTRSGTIGADSALSGVGKVGNSITAITGSTFGTGNFVISVSDVQSDQQKKLENNIVFRDTNGAIINRTTSLSQGSGTHNFVLNGTFVNGIYTGGMSLQGNDTIRLTGANADGTTFQGVFTYIRNTAQQRTVDTTMNDFKFSSMSGLIKELNYRTRDYSVTSLNGSQTRFEDALFTFTSSGTLMLTDDIGRSNSKMSFSLTFQNGTGHTATTLNPTTSFTFQDDAKLDQEGYAGQATFSINGGPTKRAEAGQVVTLFGEKSTVEGVPQPQVTFRVGSNITAGTDTLDTTAKQYVGTLNGGPSVTFGAGAQKVVFETTGSIDNPAKNIMINFDSIIKVTSSGTSNDTGATVLISTVNTGLNFQIGANSGQAISFSMGDLRADNLGFGRGSSKTVKDINVTSLSGANAALSIIDEALSQVNRTRSILGAATNRLQSTIANLSVSSENLLASESRIRDADVAGETTKYAQSQVLLQAGVSVLAQTNFRGQGFLKLLG